MVHLSQRAWEFLDLVGFISYVIVVILIFFNYSKEVAIYLLLGMMGLILLTYIPSLVRRFKSLQYISIMKICKQYEILREEELVKLSGKSPENIHSQLFKMQNLWNDGSLFIFVKRYYIYVSKPVVDAFVEALCKKSTMEENIGAEMIKQLSQKYRFQTRLEVDALVLKIREKELIEQRMKKEN